MTHVLTGSAQTEDPKAELPPWKKKLKETVIYLDNEDFLKLCKKHKVDSSKAPGFPEALITTDRYPRWIYPTRTPDFVGSKE